MSKRLFMIFIPFLEGRVGYSIIKLLLLGLIIGDVSSVYNLYKNKCPLDNKCLTPRIVYRADVTNDQTQEQKFYYGISDTPFKERYENHKKSFRHKEYSTETDLAKYCWELKNKGAVPTVKFSIAKCVKGKSLINNCSLCLSEKLFIIRSLNDVNMLNKKSEFISKCRHINKRLLIKVKDDSND